MKLIFAQGNPGAEYTKSRHNVGWLALDNTQRALDLPEFQTKTKFKAEIVEFSHHGEKVILAKPTTFYNLAGQSARAIVDFYQIKPNDILVIHDDLTLEFGKLRVRQGGADAGNNGIKSLNQHLDNNFWRLKIGTNSQLRGQIPEADFVLQAFSKNEQTILAEKILPEAQAIILDFLDNNIANYSQKLA